MFILCFFGLFFILGIVIGIVNAIYEHGRKIRLWAGIVSICMTSIGFILCICSQWMIGFAFFIGAIILTVCTSYDPSAKQMRKKNPYYGIHLSKQQIYNLEQHIELPVLSNTPVFLYQGEVAVYYCEAIRQETKNRVVGRTENYGGVAKSFSIRTGGNSSRPIYGDISTHYSGQMVLTNQRLIFISNQKSFGIPYNAITAVTAYNDGLSVQSGNHTYTLLLPQAELAVLAFDAARTGSMPLAGMSTGVSKSYDKYDYEDEIDVNDISYVDGLDGHEFEYFCADLLRKNGFTDVSVTPGSGDQGVDVLAEKGGVKYAIQCKNYASPLSNTPVQEVNAGKTFYGCHVGVVMTNSTFTPGAKELAKATGVLLWDRTVVQEMMRVKNNE